MTQQTNVAQYILTRLKQLGADHIFGVPGDFGLNFFDEIQKSQLEYVGACNELNAAYAADGYARIKGIGVVAVTHTVGELSALNGIAGSFAERVPVVIIVGSPSNEAYKSTPLLHHTLGDYEIPHRMFEMVTGASTVLHNVETAPEQIDWVLSECLQHQKPVYLSLPTDIVTSPCHSPQGEIERKLPVTNVNSLKEAIGETIEMLEKSKRPIIIADVELIRYHLKDEFENLLEASGIPYSTLMMGKTVIDEQHPLFIGLYAGNRSRKYVKERIESADFVLELGVFLSDLNTGGFSIEVDPKKVVRASYDKVKISHHYYENIFLRDFLVEFSKRVTKRDPKSLDIHSAQEGCVHRSTEKFEPEPERELTVHRTFDRLSSFIPRDSIVIAETGQCLFSAAETLMPQGTIFIGQVFYGSIGYALGATLGIATAAKDRPVILFIGDGSFQVTAQELSSMIRYNLTPTIFLLNNEGYLIERLIRDGTYNDIQNWNYSQLPHVFGGKGPCFDVHKEAELEEALKVAEKERFKNLTFIELHTGKMDASENMKKAGKAMAKANKIVSMTEL